MKEQLETTLDNALGSFQNSDTSKKDRSPYSGMDLHERAQFNKKLKYSSTGYR